MKHPRLVLAAAALAVILGCLCGCRRTSAPPGDAAAWAPDTYYLFPGDPAPVEGPQLPATDYERLLDELDRLDARIANLERLLDDVQNPDGG